MERLRTVTIKGYEEFVSEQKIAEFCGKCSCFGCDGVCRGLLRDPAQSQANMVSGRNCWWAVVDGVSGEIDHGKFIPTRWLENIVEPALSNITPEIKQMVESVDLEKIAQAKEAIEQKITAIARETGKDERYYYVAYFNNFHCHLVRRFDLGGDYRALSFRNGSWDITRRESLDKVYNESQLYLDQTPRQFHATVDACVLAEGLSFERIIRLQDAKIFKDLFEYTKPVFARLLALGYHRYPDLIA